MKFLPRRRRPLAVAALIASLATGALTAGAYARDEGGMAAEQSFLAPTPEAVIAAEETPVAFESRPIIQPLPAPVAPAPRRAAEAASLRELVGATALPDSPDPQFHCLAAAVYFEARGEPLEGQLAVARVVLNRVASPQFPDSICAVVTQPGQFSFVRSGRLPQPSSGSAAWRQAQAIAVIAQEEGWASSAGDALYFHATHVRPRWAGQKTARATIERHVFYR